MTERVRSQLKAGSILENNDPRRKIVPKMMESGLPSKPRVTVTGIYTAHEDGKQYACYTNAKGRRCKINVGRIVEAGTKTTHGWTLVQS